MTTDSRAARGAARTKREQQGERSRQDILDAAERLMSGKGYTATTISDLAHESGLPASSIYWHFHSKNGVLGAVMERAANRFFEDGARQISAIDGDDPCARLTDMMAVSDRLVRDHPQFLRLFLLLLLGSEGEHAQDKVVARVRGEGRRRLAAGLQLAYQPWGADVAARISEQLRDTALALFDGYFIAVVAGSGDSPAQLLDQVVTMIHALAKQVRSKSVGG